MKNQTEKVTQVNAKYKTLKTYRKVLIRVPEYDKFMKFIPAHKLEINGKIVTIADHYRRPDVFLDIVTPPTSENEKPKVYVSKNFFLGIGHAGTTIVADRVDVIRKTNHLGEKNIILDIFLSDKQENVTPRHGIKIGSPTGQYEIPKSGKFVKIINL